MIDGKLLMVCNLNTQLAINDLLIYFSVFRSVSRLKKASTLSQHLPKICGLLEY